MPKALPSPIILAIDTSCDDTSAAVVQGVTVRSNIIASQTQLHKQYGGVFPTVAKQAHKEHIAATVEAALRRGQVEWSDITAVAVTQGPGLAPALEVGINYAKQLAEQYVKPIIPINHIEGHLLSVLAESWPRSKKTTSWNAKIDEVRWPVLAVIISGGHTEFILVFKPGQYQRLGWTLDDAAGEALDKIGRMLGLGYPAGPVIEEFARHGNPLAFPFPLPMTSSGDYNLSYSGLKTFSRNTVETLEAQGALTKEQIYDFCASTQYSIFRHILHKLSKILSNYQDLGEVWVGGGVAANSYLRQALRDSLRVQSRATGSPPIQFRAPYTKRLCMDNAAMIGVVAGSKLLTSNASFERAPRLAIN